MKKLPFLFVLLFLVSCSQNVNGILSSKNTVVMEYASESSKPSLRLSVFVESQGDARRYKTMKLYNLQENYEWTVENPVMFEVNQVSYCGYPDFIVPSGELIPQGAYQITFINANDDENTSTFALDYDSSLAGYTTQQARDFFLTKNAENYVSIYDANDQIIFFDVKNEKVQTENDIWLNFRESQYFYDIWLTQDRSLMCIMPKQQIKRGDTDE